MTLETIMVEPFHSNNHPSPRLGCCQRMFIDPPLEDGTEAPLSQYAVGAEIPGGGFEIAEGEAPQFGRLQDLILPTRSQRRRR